MHALMITMKPARPPLMQNNSGIILLTPKLRVKENEGSHFLCIQSPFSVVGAYYDDE